MTKVCLAIGVGDAPPLDYLRGAVNGAKAIANWATAQGYETRILTDEYKPVEFDHVKTALEQLLVGGAERLLLYFAGHGLSIGVGADLWLLSKWASTGRGVSVTALRDRLMRYGIDNQLVLISDACRTLIDERTRDVKDHTVLDPGPFDEKLPQWDLWFAASPSRAAWMIPGRVPAESRCIFSGLLAEALAGSHPAALDQQDPSRGINNHSLANFLEAQVPEIAARYGATLEPAIQTAIRPPRNIYAPAGSIPPTPPQPTPWPDPQAVRVAGMGKADGSGRVTPLPNESWTSRQAVSLETLEQGTTRGAMSTTARSVPRSADSEVLHRRFGAPAKPRPGLAAIIASDEVAMAKAADAQTQRISATMAEFKTEGRPDHFETGAGFSLSGAAAIRGLLGRPAIAQPAGTLHWWRIEPGDPASHDPWWSGGFPLRHALPLLVELQDGRWIGAAALPRFVLTFTLDKVGAQAVIYRSMGMPYAPQTEQAMANLRAGALRREQAPELVSQLRGAKHVDPMLGVLAAYLHEAMGDVANVHRTAYYRAARGEPIPFDIALLGRLAARRDADGLVRVIVPAVADAEGARGIPGYLKNATPAVEGVVAGAFPWMRQGWALLDPDGRGALYPPGLDDVAGHLLAAPFTTLNAQGGNRLAQLLFGPE